MKISVVTISFNQATYLKQCIESVLSQDHTDFEYIVVDAGSSDGSRELILSYQDKIDHVIFEPDEGPADGLNKGFSIATGDIFYFINSDDFILPQALTLANQYFVSHPDIDVFSADALVVDKAGKTLNVFHSRRFSLPMCAYGAATLAQQSTFFRADSFNRVGGFNPKNRIAWDGELWIDLAIAGARFGRTSQKLSAFRVYDTSITGSGRFRQAYNQYTQDMFMKIMGRPYGAKDKYFRLVAKVFEYLGHPVILKDRLLKGPAIPAPHHQQSR